MEIIETPLAGCLLIRNNIIGDNRGYFLESFNQKKFEELTGTEVQFVQDNQSYSTYGVLRGLHFQVGEHAQAKLVRVLTGRVFDVAIDLRKNSETFGKWYGVELTERNEYQLYIPRGFGHGFSVLSDSATFFYKCDNYYHKPAEDGIYPLDKELNIDWQLNNASILLSEKDKQAQTWANWKSKL